MKDAMEKDLREERLPRWAQDTLKSLRRQVEDQKMRADDARMAGGPEDTDTILDPYDDTPVRLKKGEHVRFLLGPDDYQWIECSVQKFGRFNIVRVISGDSLLVYPSSSNAAHLRSSHWTSE